MQASATGKAATGGAAKGATDRATPEQLAAGLGALMKHLLVTTGRDFWAGLERAGISITQVKCLGLLAEAEKPMSLGALSDELGLSLAGLSRAVDGLVQRGELAREEDPRDRRSKLLTITPRGRKSYDRLIAVRLAGVRDFVDTLDPHERQALADGVQAVAGRIAR